jgi:hypothetical protein
MRLILLFITLLLTSFTAHSAKVAIGVRVVPTSEACEATFATNLNKAVSMFALTIVKPALINVASKPAGIKYYVGYLDKRYLEDDTKYSVMWAARANQLAVVPRITSISPINAVFNNWVLARNDLYAAIKLKLTAASTCLKFDGFEYSTPSGNRNTEPYQPDLSYNNSLVDFEYNTTKSPYAPNTRIAMVDSNINPWFVLPQHYPLIEQTVVGETGPLAGQQVMSTQGADKTISTHANMMSTMIAQSLNPGNTLLPIQTSMAPNMVANGVMSASQAPRVKVISVSVGYEGHNGNPAEFMKAVNYANTKNQVVVQAMGNDNVWTPSLWPTAPNLITVGAMIVASTTIQGEVSMNGPNILVDMSGEIAMSSGYADGNTQAIHGQVFASSGAAAIVSAQVQRMLDFNPFWTPNQIKTALIVTSKDVPMPPSILSDKTYQKKAMELNARGGGIADFNAAFKYLKETWPVFTYAPINALAFAGGMSDQWSYKLCDKLTVRDIASGIYKYPASEGYSYNAYGEFGDGCYGIGKWYPVTYKYNACHAGSLRGTDNMCYDKFGTKL